MAGVGAALADSFAVPPGRALVYVIQSDTGGFGNVAVFVDKKMVGGLKTNTYVAFSADPGAHVLSAAGAGLASHQMSVDSGKVYYVSLRINAGGIPQFRVLSEADAKPLLARYRPIRSDVVTTRGTASATPPPPAATPAPARAAPSAAAPARRAAATPPAKEPVDEFVLLIKTGTFKASNEQQSWFNVATTVDGASSGVFGAELDYVFPAGWAVGAELMNYKNSWQQANGAKGSFKTVAFTVNGKKYFNETGMVRPFVGVGVGSAAISFSGDITGSTGGLAYQFFGGVEFLFPPVDLHIELKSLSADTEDNSGQSVDASGIGLFVGMSIHF
jgi:uncharacterized protein DUF2846